MEVYYITSPYLSFSEGCFYRRKHWLEISGVFSDILSILSSIKVFTSGGKSSHNVFSESLITFTSALLAFAASSSFARDLAVKVSVGAMRDVSDALVLCESTLPDHAQIIVTLLELLVGRVSHCLWLLQLQYAYQIGLVKLVQENTVCITFEIYSSLVSLFYVYIVQWRLESQF